MFMFMATPKKAPMPKKARLELSGRTVFNPLGGHDVPRGLGQRRMAWASHRIRRRGSALRRAQGSERAARPPAVVPAQLPTVPVAPPNASPLSSEPARERERWWVAWKNEYTSPIGRFNMTATASNSAVWFRQNKLGWELALATKNCHSNSSRQIITRMGPNLKKRLSPMRVMCVGDGKSVVDTTISHDDIRGLKIILCTHMT